MYKKCHLNILYFQCTKILCLPCMKIVCVICCVLLSKNNENIIILLDTHLDMNLMSWIICFCDQSRVANKQINIFSLFMLFISYKFDEGLAT